MPESLQPNVDTSAFASEIVPPDGLEPPLTRSSRPAVIPTWGHMERATESNPCPRMGSRYATLALSKTLAPVARVERVAVPRSNGQRSVLETDAAPPPHRHFAPDRSGVADGNRTRKYEGHNLALFHSSLSHTATIRHRAAPPTGTSTSMLTGSVLCLSTSRPTTYPIGSHLQSSSRTNMKLTTHRRERMRLARAPARRPQ